MTSRDHTTQADARADPLVAEVDRIRALLEARLGGGQPPSLPPQQRVPALDHLVDGLGLTGFERDVLMLTAGVELDGQIASLVAEAIGGDDPRPTFSLALSMLGDGHWDAIVPDHPLRYWRLIDLEPGAVLAARRLQIDERILHFLTEVPSIDPRLARFGLRTFPAGGALSTGQAAIAQNLIEVVSDVQGRAGIGLVGDDPNAQLAVALAVINRLGGQALALSADSLPAPGPDLAALIRLLDREAVLAGVVPIVVGCDGRDGVVSFVMASASTPVLFFIGDTRAGPGTGTDRVWLPRRIDRPTPEQQRQLWHTTLRSDVAEQCGRTIEELSHEHRLDSSTLRSIAVEVNADEVSTDRASLLKRLCRERTRLDAGTLAQRIEPLATWDDIVLPDAHMALLRDIAGHVRHRRAVYDEWEFTSKTSRGLGITALFAGESGTGKTMAAEVLANDLGLDLYRIDLAATVSKYIGETEKNLARLFDAAEASGAILLFDEADALFGKRGDVKDSHDRYANMEVAYLLQRMESYRGLAILTTNLRDSIDPAFVRRIRFVVRFPFPDPEHRARIWDGVFPEATPVSGLEPRRLARMAIPGGSIWSIALAAAFSAAGDGGVVTPDHVLRAARVEYAKSDRVLTESEMAGWA